ncbi:MAG TPA: serine/threonine protein kinase [Ramlibacter sp.]|nr:serine/threonine protein kinase [Ramlibacter sp.]
MANEEQRKDDGPGKVGLTSDKQPNLVAPSGVNERDHGAADDKPMAGDIVNLDDDDMAHPRGKVTSQGGTEQAQGGDSAPLGPPAEIQSDRNGPSDRSSRN